MSGAVREIKIGETNYRLAPFRAYKAVLAGRIVARVSDEITKVIDELANYVAEYQGKHKLRITREMAEMQAETNPNYQALLDGVLKVQPYIELPDTPSFEEQLLAVFSKVFEFAEAEAQQLLALVVISNSDLRKAREEDRIFEELNELGQRILDDAELGELVELIAAAYEVVQEQLAPHREALGKLQRLYRRAEIQTQPTEETETSSPSTKSSPESSTDSPAPTDGTMSEPSSVPAGAS